MSYVKITAFGMAVVIGLCWQVPADATTLFGIDILRTSPDREAPTSSGSGLLRFDGPASSVADIDFFSLQIETIGGTFVDSERMRVQRRFVFGLPDILSVTDLVARPALGGVIELASKASEDSDVILGEGTRLDFTDGLASGFCFDAVGGAECIFGGGSSTGIRAELSSTIIPLPWSLPLLVAALGVLGLLARPGAGRRIGPA